MDLFKRDPDPFASSRYSSVFKSVRERQRRHMQKRWQWWVLGIFLILTVLGGAAIWKYFDLKCQISCGGPQTSKREEGRPFNALLVGSDSREGLTPEEQLELGANAVPGQRADTLILAHFDPAEDHAVLVQFPRDLWVPIAGGGENRINAALEGGARQLLRTMTELTDLKIHHYVQVNIAGFRDLIDAIDGVDLCIPEATAYDSNTGFQVTKPGTIHFDGELAIRYVRSRKIFPRGDFDRIANQQRFIAAALDKVTSVGTLLNPGRILKLADIAGKNLQTDVNMTPFGLKDLANNLRSLDPEHFEAYTVPNLGVGNIAGASVVLPDEAGMRFVFEALGRNESPAEADGVPNIDPHTVRVGVYNGVDLLDTYATSAAEALLEASGGPVEGFQIDPSNIANAPHFKFKETLIRYEAPAAEMAKLVAAVVPGATLQEHSTPEGVDVAVIVGRRRFRTAPLVQILPIPIPPPADRPAVCDQKGEAVSG
ncbi:MAG TPA: LCP family protein [Actinomycetota bacterium]|nr:LCP family protein [Actinomycetota bacterium]